MVSLAIDLKTIYLRESCVQSTVHHCTSLYTVVLGNNSATYWSHGKQANVCYEYSLQYWDVKYTLIGFIQVRKERRDSAHKMNYMAPVIV
jgi:hypothetical protein